MTTEQATEPSNLVEALVKVQGNLPTITKDQKAQVGQFSYRYADLAQITEKLMPLLAENGLAWVARPTYDNEGRFVLAYSLMHVSGESITGSYPLVAASSKPQEVGSSISYSRRYALCSVVGVVPDDDDDATLAQQAKPHRSGSRAPEGAKASTTSNARRQSADAAPSEPTGNTVNLQKLYLSELVGPQRPAFVKWLHDNMGCTPTEVPLDKQADVEAAIQNFATGEVAP